MNVFIKLLRKKKNNKIDYSVDLRKKKKTYIIHVNYCTNVSTQYINTRYNIHFKFKF